MQAKGGKIALCVAEKPSVAKSIAELLGNGKFNKVSGHKSSWVLTLVFLTAVYGEVEVQPNF